MIFLIKIAIDILFSVVFLQGFKKNKNYRVVMLWLCLSICLKEAAKFSTNKMLAGVFGILYRIQRIIVATKEWSLLD